MGRGLVSIERETPMLMPPAIQGRAADDDMARFVVEAAGALGEESCSFNWRGGGSQQYPPAYDAGAADLLLCHLRGMAKVGTEWDLVCLAFNIQLLNRFLPAQKAD